MSMEIPTKKIAVPEDFIRSESEAKKNLGQLAKSIEQVGLIHPIKVAPKDDGYELVAGFRRLLAVRDLLRQETIRAEVLGKPVDMIERTRIGLIENIQREALIRREMIDAAVLLYKHYRTYKDVADKLGIDYTFARDLVGLVDAPDEFVKYIGKGRGKIGRQKAIEILKAYPDPEDALKIVKTFVSGELTSEEKERIFEIIKEKPGLPPEELKKEIPKPRKRYEFPTVLPEAYYNRFLKACEERDMEPPELAKSILIEWIDKNVPA
ncbi:MAG: ParB/RepB/Spo0J family partition protein [Candidatus Bathyarchaeia archaeon]|jgi:ParB family chromosome partitioning protein|nr:ParB/RepB/Spo0J family partition protein [Candidatus Bathyarchaeota archaeon A05DMB-3]